MKRRNFIWDCALASCAGCLAWSVPSVSVAAPESPSVTGLLEGLEGYPASELTRATLSAKMKICVVDSKSDQAGSEFDPGTLRYCLASAAAADSGEMTWITFDPGVFPPTGGGEIALENELVLGGNTIIDGRGARVTIHSTRDVHLLKLVGAKNVILKNLILHKAAPFSRSKGEKSFAFPIGNRPGIDRERAARGMNGDGISFRGACDNVWIDHCTFFLCGDESIGVMSSAEVEHTKITVSWCDFSDQYYVALVGHTTEQKKEDARIRLTFHHNRSRGAGRRSPRVNRAHADIYNNYLDGWIDWAMAANASSRVLIEANIFKARESKTVISIGVGKHESGFVRLRDNVLMNGARIDSHHAERVPEPAYERRVDEAGESLRVRLNRSCGWQHTTLE